MNQLSPSSAPNVAEVKIQARAAPAPPPSGTCSRRVCMVEAMSSGDSTSRSCAPTSSQRTASGAQAPTNPWASSCSWRARSAKRCRSGPSSCTASRACAASAQAATSACKAACQLAMSMRCGAGPDQARRWPPAGKRPAHSRNSRAACSSAAACCGQSRSPRACCKPMASKSRTKSSTCAVDSCRPRNCTPVSLS